MLAALNEIRSEHDFDIEVVDIDVCPEKLAQYDQWVPVLTTGEEEICHYFLDPAKVREVLWRFR